MINYVEPKAVLFICCLFCFFNQEDLIQSTDPDSLQVSTKDMDSTLSKASRAIKKTSKKVKADKIVMFELSN